MTSLLENLFDLDSKNQALTLELAALKKEREKLVDVVQCARAVAEINTTTLDEYDHESLARLDEALEPFKGVMCLQE